MVVMNYSFVLRSITFLTFTVFTWTCTGSELVSSVSSTSREQDTDLSAKQKTPDRAKEQIKGYVTFQNGSPPRGNPEIYCYYQDQLMQTDLIDNDGLYHFTGPDPVWPTGSYFVQTQIIWVKDKRYSGEKWVYHTQGTTNWNEDITLFEIVRGGP